MGVSVEFQAGEDRDIAAIIAFDERGLVVDVKTERNEQ